MCFWPLKARWKQFNFVFAILPIKQTDGKAQVWESWQKNANRIAMCCSESKHMYRYHYTSSDELRSHLRGQEPQSGIVGISHYRTFELKSYKVFMKQTNFRFKFGSCQRKIFCEICFILCVWVFCLFYVCGTCFWCLQRSVEGIRSPGTSYRWLWMAMWVLGLLEE